MEFQATISLEPSKEDQPSPGERNPSPSRLLQPPPSGAPRLEESRAPRWLSTGSLMADDPPYVMERVLRSPRTNGATLDHASGPQLPLLEMTDEHADTLVFIDPAPSLARRPHGQMSALVSGEVLSIPHRLHSKSLLDTGSKFFNKCYEPASQARIRRRRGLGEILPQGARYVLDLTPATEGDEALIFITELSCPMGIRTWTWSWDRWRLPWSCVGGQEETESPPAEEATPTSLSASPGPRDEGLGHSESKR
jgi:hypothetical protein